MGERLVVVGASLAGLRAVETARREGHTGEVVLVGAEEHLPYDRPPLSKACLAPGEEVVPHLLDEAALDALDVDLRLGSPATGLDVEARELHLGQERVSYDALVVATGAHARTLPASVPGRDLPGVRVLRTLDDARAVRAALDAGARTVVVGAGFVGSEVASAVRARGLPVTLLEAAPQPLVRALGEEVAGLLCALHGRAGTDLRLGTSLSEVLGDDRVTGVRLSDGSTLDADLVVVGTGATPVTGWLEGSGLTLDDGVVCDASLCAAPGVWAAGDVARWRTPGGGTRRLEHWTAAAEQGALAARNAVTGAAVAYAPVPFVWTEWYGTKVHLLGDCRGDDVRLVGDPAGDRWLALYREQDLLVGAVGVGLPGRTPKLRRRVGQPFEEAVAFAEAA
ncbi:MAG: pyridine nucleotide-disulfide oxidoreductase [Frankiales bacterium]|nr:pyridine nucleotide-disulfide oxidoreductase [Frankiales bacterium]